MERTAIIEKAVKKNNANVETLVKLLNAEGIKARVGKYNEYLGTIEKVIKCVQIYPEEIDNKQLETATDDAFYYYGWRFEVLFCFQGIDADKPVPVYMTNNATMLRQKLGIRHSVSKY